MRRISALGRTLASGQKVPVDIVRDGVEIWQKYADRMLDVHVGQFVAARTVLPHTEECRLPLIELQDEPTQSAARLNEVRTLLDGYAVHPGLYQALLGNVLIGLATSELAWAGFEGDFANSCLPMHLSDTALAQWRTALIETELQIDQTRVLLQAFLERSKEYAWPDPATK